MAGYFTNGSTVVFHRQDFVAVLRFRLGLDIFTEGRCPHVNADGVQCSQLCDRRGRHLFKCQTGGGWIMAHDSTLVEYCHLSKGPDGIPGATFEWKPHVPAWPRRTRDAEADVGFVIMLRFRLGLDTFTEGRCPHVNADGVQCREVCDRKGRHLFKCQTGGGWIMAHDAVLVEVCHLVEGPDGIPSAKADWKPHVAAWPRRDRDAEADVGFYRLPGMRDTYVDAVISYTDPVTYPGCESTPGHVAELKVREKHRTHPVLDERASAV